MQKEILEILRTNSRISDDEMAVMLGTTAEAVKSAVKELEAKGIIMGYNTLIDWEKAESETVTAYIEVKVTPQRGQGFDKVAERIYQFPQVSACSLMSGGFDLFVVVEGKTMKEVALFVAEKLAPIEGVLSCATHFVLKKYKDNGIIFNRIQKDDREAVVL
ncbi:MAG: Lrp/AsnC family transcriptional regulator [Clostridia bacterium]|nr:Lrp/AsnC family transcriptional regulator [Clostridia bacterium]